MSLVDAESSACSDRMVSLVDVESSALSDRMGVLLVDAESSALSDRMGVLLVDAGSARAWGWETSLQGLWPCSGTKM